MKQNALAFAHKFEKARIADELFSDIAETINYRGKTNLIEILYD